MLRSRTARDNAPGGIRAPPGGVLRPRPPPPPDGVGEILDLGCCMHSGVGGLESLSCSTRNTHRGMRNCARPRASMRPTVFRMQKLRHIWNAS